MTNCHNTERGSEGPVTTFKHPLPVIATQPVTSSATSLNNRVLM